MTIRSFVHKLFEMGAVKFGNFTLKSGMASPIYIDLRLTISNPKLLVAVAEAMHDQVKNFHFDLICGVPYTALPFATAISIQHNIPMVLVRKEKKEYGTGKQLEGNFQKGQNCLLIEDVITSGKSIFETMEVLLAEGLNVEDVVVFVDREQGGAKRLAEKGIRLHSICSISTIVEILHEDRKINSEMAAAVLNFIKEHQVYG